MSQKRSFHADYQNHRKPNKRNRYHSHHYHPPLSNQQHHQYSYPTVDPSSCTKEFERLSLSHQNYPPLNSSSSSTRTLIQLTCSTSSAYISRWLNLPQNRAPFFFSKQLHGHLWKINMIQPNVSLKNAHYALSATTHISFYTTTIYPRLTWDLKTENRLEINQGSLQNLTNLIPAGLRWWYVPIPTKTIHFPQVLSNMENKCTQHTDCNHILIYHFASRNAESNRQQTITRLLSSSIHGIAINHR